MYPTIFEKDERGVERTYDLVSRLLKDRIILLVEEINTISATSIIAQLLFLESENPEAPITIYINSPGGSISDGLAIYDVMNKVKCPITTICIGMAASMGAFLLAAGAKGKRYALPHSEIMIHQPLGQTKGQATEILIHAEHIKKTRDTLNKILAERTGKTLEEIEKDTERDNFMSAEEALEYGLIDKVITNRQG